MNLPKAKTRGAVANIKFFLIPMATAGGLILGLGLNQINKPKNSPAEHSQNPAGVNNSSAHAETLKTIRVLRQRSDAAGVSIPSGASRGGSEGSGLKRVRLFSEIASLQENGNSGMRKPVAPSSSQNSLLKVKDYIKTVEEKNAFLSEKVNLLTALADSKEKELSKLAQDNTGLKEDLNKIIEAENKLKSDFATDFNTLNMHLAEKDSRILDLNTLKLSLESQISEMGNKLAIFAGERTSMQKQLDQLREEKALMEIDLVKVKEDLGRQSELNTVLNDTLIQFKGQLTDKEKANLAMAKELERLQLSSQDMGNELKELRTVKANSQDEADQLNGRIEELNLALAEAKESAAQAVSLLSKRKLERELKIRDKESEISDLKDGLVKAEEEKNTLMGYLEEKEKAIGDLKLALSNMEAQMATFEKRLSLEKEKLTAASEQASKTESEKSALLLSLQEKVKNTEELKRALSNMEAQMAGLQDKFASERQRQEETRKQLEKALSLNDYMKNKLKSIYVEIELLRTERKFEIK